MGCNMKKVKELDVWQETLQKEWRTQKTLKGKKNVQEGKRTQKSGQRPKQMAKVNLDHDAEKGLGQGKAHQEK